MPREGRSDHHLFVMAGLVIHDLSLPLAGEGAPLIIPASQPCIRLTLSLVHGTRAAYRLYLGTRGAAPEVPAERTRVARCAPARCRRLDNGPATGVLEPHALGGIPGSSASRSCSRGARHG